MKFTITQEKEEYIARNIQFSKDLFNSINKIKGNISLNKFVIKAVKYALNNMEEK